MKKINILFRIAVLIVFLGSINACSTDDLEPTLAQNKNINGGLTSVENIHSLIKGAYSGLTVSGYYGRDYIINNEVRSDNCFSNGNSGRFTTQASFSYNENTGYFWDDAYEVIANANVIIGLDLEELDGDTDWARHIQGQAYALRALCHFDMVKQYGQQHVGGTLGVPYVTEFKGEDLFPARNTVTEVRDFILQDLNTAFDLMDASYDESTEFFTKYAAKALEANVAIYFEQWATAQAACEEVINNGGYSIISANDYVSHWTSDMSANSIFELAFNSTDNQGINGLAYIYRTTGGGSYGDVQVIDEVINLYDAADVRAGILGYEGVMLRNIGKYPDNQGYDNVVVMRYEEVILNYAEALFELSATGIGGLSALDYLNQIPENRGLGAGYYATASKDNILEERRKEFIFEGKRFEELVRMGKDIEKLYLQQNFAATIPYGDYRLAWPIPSAEMDANSNMVQNDGY